MSIATPQREKCSRFDVAGLFTIVCRLECKTRHRALQGIYSASPYSLLSSPAGLLLLCKCIGIFRTYIKGCIKGKRRAAQTARRRLTYYAARAAEFFRIFYYKGFGELTNVSKSCNASSSAEKSSNGSASPGRIVSKSSSSVILHCHHSRRVRLAAFPKAPPACFPCRGLSDQRRANP